MIEIPSETRRRILVDALTTQAERYRAQGRGLMDVAARKSGNGFEAEAREKFRLALTAEKIRDEIKRG